MTYSRDLAAACATDGRRSLLYTAAPLSWSGVPVNPVVIR